MTNLKKLKNINTYDDLELFCESHNLNMYSDISYRGGGIGVTGSSLANYLHISESLLPRNFGAGCNYLGGGVRGSIFPSNCSTDINETKFMWLMEFGNACVRVYEDIENDAQMNDTEDENGDTNWDALATVASRNAGIKSAY